MTAMTDFRVPLLLALLAGWAYSGSAQLNSSNDLKSTELTSGKKLYQSVFPPIINDDDLKKTEVVETNNRQNSRLGFIIFGNLQDLDKFRIYAEKSEEIRKDLNENVILKTFDQKESDFVWLKYFKNYLNIKGKYDSSLESKIHKNQYDDTRRQVHKTDDRDNNVLNLLTYNGRQSFDYNKNNGKNKYRKTNIDIFSEDEYDDYKVSDTTSSDEDMSRVEEEEQEEDERFHEEDEKYYEDEFNNMGDDLDQGESD